MRHISETFLSLNTLQDTSTYHAALRLNQVEPITQDYVNKGSLIFSWLFENWARKYGKLLFLLNKSGRQIILFKLLIVKKYLEGEKDTTKNKIVTRGWQQLHLEKRFESWGINYILPSVFLKCFFDI